MQPTEQRTSIRDAPLELLVSIFRWSFDINTTSLQKDRCRLSLVCRYWRDVVQGSACLWTDISAHDSESYIERSLVKSAGLPIAVHYFSPSLYRSEGPDLQAYLKLVLKHLPRCRSISLLIRTPIEYDFKELLIGLRATPVPLLESLALKGDGPQRIGVEIESDLQFPEMTAFPALRWLEVEGISCQLAPPGLVLKDFRSLNLIDLDKTDAEQLLEVLRNSPRLERLGLGRSPLACPSQSAVAPIHVPHLIALHLIFLPIPISNFFLATIHDPNCSELFISSRFPELPDNLVRRRLFTSNTDHFSSIMQRLLTRGRYKDISFFGYKGYGNCGISFWVDFHDDDLSHPRHSGIFRLEFRLHSIGQVEETIQWLASYLDRDVPKIPIRLKLEGLEDFRLLNLIDSHMAITHLQFRHGLRDSLLVHMGKPSSSGWPLPDLEVLVYDPWNPPESQNETMLDMLRRRYKLSPNEVDSGRMLPRPLSRVRIGACPTRTVGQYVVEEVKKILPQVKTSLIDANERGWTW